MGCATPLIRDCAGRNSHELKQHTLLKIAGGSECKFTAAGLLSYSPEGFAQTLRGCFSPYSSGNASKIN